MAFLSTLVGIGKHEDPDIRELACLIHENEGYVFWGLFFEMESDCEASRAFWERGIAGKVRRAGFSSTAPLAEWTKMDSRTGSSRQPELNASATLQNRA